MRFSKITLVCLLALVCLTQACSPLPQALTPQVITVVVTAAPTLRAPEGEPTATEILSATLVSSATVPATETAVPSSTAIEMASATPAPSATLPPTGTPAPVSTAALAPTPTAPPVLALKLPSVSNLPAQGPQGGSIDFSVAMSPEYLMRIKAKKKGAANDGDGIDHVLFIVSKPGGGQVYANKESSAKYCIFQGGEPDCNPWPKSGSRYVWGSGGSEITSGDYQVTIRVALKSDPSNESEWSFGITIKLP